MQKLDIVDPLKLDSLNDVIHDEYFKLEDIIYDKEGGVVEIPFRRIFHYHQPPRIIQRRWFWKVGEVDALRCLLRISHVQQYEVADQSRIGTYSFDAVEHASDSNLLIFTCCQDCELRLTVSHLAIEYREIEYRGKARITYYPFGDSNDARIYE
ncbi:MAG: hypothetical protein HY595_03705 [Candidatus Omnitrophica bacterium]|nr:hypothetical protein [Candidatus Omnitrophota bacterium]